METGPEKLYKNIIKELYASNKPSYMILHQTEAKKIVFYHSNRWDVQQFLCLSLKEYFYQFIFFLLLLVPFIRPDCFRMSCQILEILAKVPKYKYNQRQDEQNAFFVIVPL